MKESTIFNVKELLEVADCCFVDEDHGKSNCTNCPYCSDDDCEETWKDEIHELLRSLKKKGVTKIEVGYNKYDDEKLPTVLVIDRKLDESALTDASLK